MKADRLIALLLALNDGGKRSAAALADELEVSTRTIYRDVDSLAAAGVPVAAERGAQGGIVLADSYRRTLARFDESEIRALFVSTDDVLGDVGIASRRGSALAKLAGSLSTSARGAVARDRGRVHVDPRGWSPAAQPLETLATLRDAVFADRRIAIGYRGRDGELGRRALDPLGLVAKAGVWYLVARDGDSIKTFRVQRVASVRVLDERFKRPRDFDVGTYWKSAAAAMPLDVPCVATVRMTGVALSHARVYLRVESATPAAGDGDAWIVRIAFPSEDAALFEAFGWRGGAIVLEPRALRERIVDRARALLDGYDAPARTPADATNANDPAPRLP